MGVLSRSAGPARQGIGATHKAAWRTMEMTMYTQKMVLACLATMVCISAEAQRDQSSRRDAYAQRNFEACVDNSTRGQQHSRKSMRNIEEQCRRRVTAEDNRPALQGGRQRESVQGVRPRESAAAAERRGGQVIENNESNSVGGTLRRKSGD